MIPLLLPLVTDTTLAGSQSGLPKAKRELQGPGNNYMHGMIVDVKSDRNGQGLANVVPATINNPGSTMLISKSELAQ